MTTKVEHIAIECNTKGQDRYFIWPISLFVPICRQIGGVSYFSVLQLNLGS
jgi:hypothetical protein